MNIKDIEKMAISARIKVTEEEKNNLLKDMDAILKYVDQIKEAVAFSTETTTEKPYGRNVWREDAIPHEGGIFTEILLASAPSRHGQYVKVKKIL